MFAKKMAVGVAAVLAASAFGQGSFVVRDCTVVYEEAFARTQGDAWGRDAAKDLAEILSKVTDSTVKAYPESKAPANPGRVIYLGRCEASKGLDTSAYSPCEFRVKVTPERVFLLGRTETAASYAMTEFVERFCGYLFLSQNGENPYDAKPDLSVAPCDFTRRPAIEYRRIYRGYVNGMLGPKDMPRTAGNFHRFARQRRACVRSADIEPGFRARTIDGSDCHLVYKYLHPDKYFKDHPEWYSMDRNGNRNNILNAGCQLCYSNMEMRDEFARNLLSMIEADKAANPTNYAFVYDMGQGDSCTRLCFCPNCSKVVEKYNRVKGGNWEGGDCGLQLEFANDMVRRVHAKHPEIKLRIFAYVSSEERPKAIGPAPGVIPWFCDLYTFCNHMLPLEHPMNKVKLDNLRDWCGVSEYVKIWDYMLYGTTPEANVDAIAADARLFKRLGIKDVFMESEFHYQPFYDMHVYLMSELYFDPDQDADALVSRWCRVYGRAAPKMLEAIGFLRGLERTEIPKDLQAWHIRSLPWYTAGNLERFRALCREAYASAETPAARQRIAIAISGADDKLISIYRGTWGRDAQLKEAVDEYLARTKEWATYELDDPAAIAATAKKIDARMEQENIHFRDLPKELAGLPAADLKCQDWHGKRIGVSNNADSEIVDDPNSETGKAAVLHFRRPGRTMSLPLPGGFYDVEQKKMLGTYSLEIPPEKRDGKYHWYNLGQVTIGRTTKAWFHGSWGIAFPFQHLYVNCDGAPADLNTYEMWVSVKVVGSKAIYFDRCVMRRVVDKGKENPAERARGAHNWQKVDLREIKVRGEIGRRVDLAIYGNLLKMELEKQFFEHFREKKLEGDSVGTGKLVEYAVRFAAYTRDPKVLALKKHVVDELLKTQDEDGYIGCLCKRARLWGYWDLAETGFIILGLSADHHYFGEKRSLAAAERAAQFIIDNWKTMPKGWETAWISGTAAAVGLCWGMEALYRETGDRRYLDFCTRERKLDTWYAPITIGRGFGIHGHSATHLYQCIVQLELLGRPTPALRRAADETAAFMLDGDGSLISGACGLWECWSNDQCGRPSSGETCSTAFQVRLWDLLVQCSDTPSARWGDALERTMYNALFAAQSKDGRRIRYYAPLEGRRIYWPRDTYCCPNNFRRIMSELPEYLFYKSGDVLFANLYSECDLETDLAGVKVKVEERTSYPSDGRVEFTIDPGRPRTFGFAVRVPGWCESPTLVADGERVEVRPGTVAVVRREWKSGSKVVLELPMRLRVIAGRQRQTGRAAFLRGPVLYALNPVLNGGGEASEAESKSHEVTAEEQKAANLRKFFAKDPADYCGEMMVDAATANVVADDSVRPGGTAVEVRAATVGHAVGVTDANGSTIRLTEYPDCDANATYFRILDPAVAEPDPLFTGSAR